MISVEAETVAAAVEAVATWQSDLRLLTLSIDKELPRALRLALDGEDLHHQFDAQRSLTSHSELLIGIWDPALVNADELFTFHTRDAVSAHDGAALRRWGRAYERVGATEQAIEAYDLAGDAGDVIALRQLGQLWERLDNLPMARQTYEKAIERGDVVALRLLAQRLYADGERERAERLYRVAAAEHGDPPSSRALAAIHIARGDLAEAESLLDKAAQRNAPAARDLARLYRRRGEFDRALSALGAFNDPTSLELRTSIELERQGGDAVPKPEPEETVDDDEPEETEAADLFSLATRLTPDVPSRHDLLGMAPFVSGLAHLVQDRRTELPLAIAVTGRWGGGKSSVMLQLQERLDGWSRAAGDDDESDDGADPAPPRRWRTIAFAAWKYDRRERLWAALANAIYTQPQETMKWWQRLAFRVRLEWKRRGWLDFLRSFLWPLPIAAAAAAALLATGLGLAGVAVAAASVLAALSFGARAIGLLTDPFKRSIERYSHTPDYESQLGFTEAAENDIGCLLEVLAPGERDAVGIFVDDLDRCSSEHVVEVVETMNQIFNARREHRCLFVLGMDSEIVAAAIESQYGDVVTRLRDRQSPLGDAFGTDFLAKLVQLTVAVPAPDAAGVESLLRSIAAPQPAPASSSSVSDEADAARVRDAYATASPVTMAEAAAIPTIVAPSENGHEPEAVVEALKAARAAIIGQHDSPDVLAAALATARHLDANPRQVKRFDNAYRLQLYVANELGVADFSGPALARYARWVALRLRWPDLAAEIDRRPDLLAALERHVGEPDDEPQAHPFAADLLDRLCAPHGVSALFADDAGGGIAALPAAALLRVS